MKRIALAAIHMFAWINGWEVVVEEPDEVTAMLEVASGSPSEADVAAWIREHLVRRV